MASFGAHHKETEEYKRYVRQKKFKRKLIVILVILVLLLATMVGVWFHGRSQGKKETQEQFRIPTASGPAETSETTRLELDTLYSEIRDIGELATVEYLFTDAAKFSDSKQFNNWNIPFTEKSFILKWDGVIKAGILVDEIVIEVQEEEKKLLVTLPEAQILSYSVDSDSVEVLDEKNNILNEITVSDKVKFDADTEAAMRQRAIENGILEKARENAENIIEKILTANPAVKDNYRIEFLTP